MAQNHPESQVETMIANLPVKTGKSLEQWIAVLDRKKLDKHGDIVKCLKTEHGVTHGFANLIAHRYRDRGLAGRDPVEVQYAGKKSALRPIYDAVVGAARTLGDDVEIAPKKTYVSLRRNKQFALIQPSTQTRVDLGLNLKSVESTGRLETSGSFNAMVSHRVRLTQAADVDREIKRWLKAAYDAA